MEFAFALWFGFGFGFRFGKGGWWGVFGYGDGDAGFLVVLLAKNAANGAVNKYLFNLWF